MKWEKSIQEMKDNLLSQDNRATSHPMFVVMEDGAWGGKKVVSTFFTQVGADQFINDNEHNLRSPYVYIASGYRNDEWRAIRALLIGDSRDN